MAYTLRVLWGAKQAKPVPAVRGGPQGFPISHSTSSCGSHSFDEKTLKHTDGDDNDNDGENGQTSKSTQETETDFAQYAMDTPSAAIKALVSLVQEMMRGGGGGGGGGEKRSGCFKDSKAQEEEQKNMRASLVTRMGTKPPPSVCFCLL